MLYVEELVGRDTVNTMPRETIEAFLDHGRVRDSLTEDIEGARRTLDAFAAAGIDHDDVVATLEREGVEKFAKSFEQLFADVEAKRDQLVAAQAPSAGASSGSSCTWTRSARAPPPAPITPSSMSAADLMAVLLDGGFLRLDTQHPGEPGGATT